MTYNFDKIIDRHHTYSTQWDYVQDRFGQNDILPFSISDTDFPTSNEIIEAIKQRMRHPIFGYTRWNHAAYKQSIKTWFGRDKRVTVQTDWIAYSPSVVYTIGKFLHFVSEPGDSVAIFSPMYDAFFNTICANNRQIAPINIASAEEHYQIDWDALAIVLAQKKTTTLLLTNPHNPTGHLFSYKELARIVSLCQKNHVFIISDDIHRDIIVGDQPYTPITTITTKNVVLCCANTKTFNTPGLIGAYVLIPDSKLRDRYLTALKKEDALSSASIFGIESVIHGYNESADYVKELNQYLRQNYQILTKFLKTELPEIYFVKPEATYLAWVNVSKLNMSSQQLQNKLVNVGKVGIMPGNTYGASDHIRMNIGCPKGKLIEGLNRMKVALHS